MEEEKRSVSELKGRTNNILNTISFRKKGSNLDQEKEKSNKKKKESQDQLNKSLNVINMIPYVRKNAKMIFNKVFSKKKDTSPLTNSAHDIKKSVASSKNVIANKKKDHASIKGKIIEIQKKIRVLNFPIKDNTNNRSKLEENSLNNSNIDNLTATTVDKNKNPEEEYNKKENLKNTIISAKKKLPHGLGSTERNNKRVIPNVPVNFNRNSSEATIKNIKINQTCFRTDNNVSKQDNRIIKIPDKSSFMSLNTSPKKKKKDFVKGEKYKTDMENTGPKRKLIKILSQKDLVSKTNMLLGDPKDFILKKEIKNIHHISKTGFDGVAKKTENQDNFFIYKNLNGIITSRYFGVCDGHGIFGHRVSTYLKNHLPLTLDKKLKNNFLNKGQSDIITETFVEINNNLVKENDINCQYSGSTCVSVIYTQEKLVTANVGDSRAIVGRFENGEWVGISLTKDHKPSDKEEAERIKKNNGRIFPFKDENNEDMGPQRVWIKDEEVPGLAMSRSFGDKVAASVGVICTPEIKEYKFNKGDSFFILASDGLWEFIDNTECANIVKDFYVKNDIIGACDSLYNESKKRWMKQEEVIDDITIILVFFK